MSHAVSRCAICEQIDSTVVYEGPIRAGMPGTQSSKFRVLECRACGAQWLDPFPADPLREYLDGSYRLAYDGSTEAASYYSAHDHEQAPKLAAVGVHTVRDKVVADIGCGAGAFLDVIRGVAKRVVAVEPMQAFRAHLEKRISSVYPTTMELATAERGQINVALAFAVVEHVADPLNFLREIRKSLAKDGVVHITTPNRGEVLMRLCARTFAPFFYRTAHLWYFDVQSLGNLCRLAGFKVQSITASHAYDLSNFALWLRDGRPTGIGRLTDFDPTSNAMWRAYLEKNGWGDHLHAVVKTDSENEG